MYIELTGLSKDFCDVCAKIIKLALFGETKVTNLISLVGHEILKDDSREGRGGEGRKMTIQANRKSSTLAKQLELRYSSLHSLN